MLKFAALSITALAASTAYAQTPEAAPAAPVDSAPAASQPGAAPTAQAAPTNANAQVAAVVEAGFPKYDVNKDGKLSEAEFKQWISDLKTQEMAAQGKPADPAAVSQYASAAMAAADKDKDGFITKQDLTTFLGG
ncbi:MAG TPA: EF-hand domain-containing protein [Sphingobium sp.]|uniref:EF-hand domain-containing protein n=1 Tax=Sphingobium sp. TaxID=1912891 RepID=UPI002ED03ED6